MLRAISLALVACATAHAQTAPAGHQSGEEAVILGVLDTYMHEISANDLAAMKARQTPEGMTYRHRVRPGGGWEVLARSNMEWVAANMASDQAYRERYWSPTVLIRGAMALVWTPYEFQVDGETTHCGELRPTEPTAVRPRDSDSLKSGLSQ